MYYSAYLPSAPRAHATRLPAAAAADPAAALLVPPSARLLFATAAGAGHDYAGHAECAARVPSILAALADQHLLAHPAVMELRAPPPAALEQLLPVHSARYLEALERVSSGATDVAGVVIEASPTYVTQTSYGDVLAAAGAVLALVDAVCAASASRSEGHGGGDAAGERGLAPAAFAVCRPPGHHAIPAGAMGFCLLNNAAVAARHAQRAHGLARVAIFDWDVHHGNGTQDAFYADPSVLFVSTHQAGSWPGSGKAGEAGMLAGEGYTLNVRLRPARAGRVGGGHVGRGAGAGGGGAGHRRAGAGGGADGAGAGGDRGGAARARAVTWRRSRKAGGGRRRV
jgi:acetoin utilization deacetylase AcuC-like enzyme